MPEMIYVRMAIGGNLPTALRPKLVEAISEYFPVWRDETEYAIAQIEEALNDGTSISLEYEINHGLAMNLIAFCKEHGLTYWHHNAAAGAEIEPQIRIWNPNFDDEGSIPAETQGIEPILSLSELKAATDRGESIFDVIEWMRLFTKENVPRFEFTIPGLTDRPPEDVAHL